jgi:hypothetical protein
MTCRSSGRCACARSTHWIPKQARPEIRVPDDEAVALQLLLKLGLDGRGDIDVAGHERAAGPPAPDAEAHAPPSPR